MAMSLISKSKLFVRATGVLKIVAYSQNDAHNLIRLLTNIPWHGDVGSDRNVVVTSQNAENSTLILGL